QWTPLHVAAEKGHDAVVQALLSSPVTSEQIATQLNAKNKDDWTPLHFAAWYGKDAVIEILLAKGADVRARTLESQWTPLHLAALFDHVEVVKALLSDSVHQDQITEQLNAKNKNDWTPLYIAAQEGRFEIAKRLIEKGADVMARTSEGHGQWTALHIAAKKGHIAVIEALLSEPVLQGKRTEQLNAKDGNGRTPLYIAAAYGHDAVVKALLSDSVHQDQITEQLNAKNKNDWTPLYIAAANGHDAVVKALLDPKYVTPEQITAQLNAKNKDDWTPLHFAARYGRVEIVKRLIEKGAVVDAQTSGGYTPLHLVIYRQKNAQDQQPTPEAAAAIARAVLAKLQDQGMDKDAIERMLKSLGDHNKGKEFKAWVAEARKPENEWYKQVLLEHNVNPKVGLLERLFQ
ncbi:MAG: ankyrin repeat domain-containing protein, partial [Puniceicoccales bacterium]|nr:ankyrin repeat domain-containing protein [Puniceicoccales bacterium]